MLKGDLSATPLSDVLSSLADQSATGCLHIDDESGDEALVYFKNGRVYAAYVPGRRPQLGARLISSGALAPEALAEALDAQETELQGWRLGELLVHLGYVERPVVEAFVLEQLREAAFDLSRWPSGRFRFRKNEKTREDVGSHAAVPDLLDEVTRRRVEWDVMSGVVHGPGAVPVLSAGGLASAEMALDQDQWALLCKVDGERTIAQLARDCGFTSYEAGQIVYALVGAGLLQVEETFEETETEAEPEAEPPVIDEQLAPLGAALASAFATQPGEEPYGGSEISRLLGAQAEAPAEESTGGDLKDELASLTAALADLPSLAPPADLAPEYPAAPEEPFPTSDDPFGDSLARVSHALSALLGESLPAVAMPAPPPKHEPTAAELAAAREEAERLDRIRAAAAAELAQAHAMAEAERQAAEEAVRLEAERAVAEEEAWAEYAQRAVAEQLNRLDAERQAAETARLEAERRAAEEAARLEAERRAAEEAARLEAERLAAERRAAEEAARLEAERLDAERRAAEEAARLEAERLDAERRAAEEAARLEAERLAAEEAARLEADRLAAEEAARLEAERLAAEAAAQLEAERQEAERRAAEEAARRAAEEAERLAAEEAARLEAEARVRAERYAAEEAARAEAEEAARAADEAARAADEAAHAAALHLIPDPAPAPAGPPADEPAAFDVASLLRDINAAPAAPADTVETVEEYFLETPPAEPEPPATNGNSRPLSDTAALLRELTSLGLDDEPANPAAAAGAAVNRPQAQAKEQPKKRKGLFGRG